MVSEEKEITRADNLCHTYVLDSATGQFSLELMVGVPEHNNKSFLDRKLTTRSPNRYNIWLKHDRFKTCLYLYKITLLSIMHGSSWEQISPKNVSNLELIFWCFYSHLH